MPHDDDRPSAFDASLTASGGWLPPPDEPVYPMVMTGGRPVRDVLPLVSAKRGGIEFVRRTPAELAVARLQEEREARVRARRRRWARPFHRLARPILWLAYRIGPDCDRPVIEPEPWWD